LESLPDPIAQRKDLEASSETDSSTGSSDSSAGVSERRNERHKADELRRTENERERVEEGIQIGCREAVEILTRNPKKGTLNMYEYYKSRMDIDVHLLQHRMMLLRTVSKLLFLRFLKLRIDLERR